MSDEREMVCLHLDADMVRELRAERYLRSTCAHLSMSARPGIAEKILSAVLPLVSYGPRLAIGERVTRQGRPGRVVHRTADGTVVVEEEGGSISIGPDEKFELASGELQ